MDAENVEDDTLEIADKEWSSLTEKAKTLGYRDGVIDGKESVYQEGFDKGYHAGFKCGYSLGVYKGIIEAKKRFGDLNDNEKQLLDDLEKNEQISEYLKKPERGLCQICKDDSLLSVPVNELVSQHSDYCKRKQSELEEKFGELMTVKITEH